MEYLRKKHKESAARKPKKLIRLQIGWQHFNREKRGYTQVKTQNGGGVCYVVLERSASFATVIGKAKDLFFPNGTSKCHGKVSNLHFMIANSRGQTLDENTFSLDEIHTEGGSRAKIYLLSKLKTHTSPMRSSSSDSSDLMDPSMDILQGQLPDEIMDLTNCDLPGPSYPSEGNKSGTPTVSFKEEPKPINICGICADRAKTSFFIPCGHSICAPCPVFIEESETKLCPFCKIEFVKVGTLFE